MLEIRPAERGELAAIVAMLAQDSMTGSPVSDVPTEAQFQAFATISARPDHELIAVLLDGRVVGTLQLTFIPGLTYDGGWRAQVEGVRVLSEVRNQRIGTQMMDWVFARARERGCRLVQLATNAARTDAQRFYTRLGFKASHVGMKRFL